MSRNMYIFNMGGLPYERGGDAGNFELDLLKKTNLEVGQPFFDPKRDRFVTMVFRY